MDYTITVKGAEGQIIAQKKVDYINSIIIPADLRIKFKSAIESGRISIEVKKAWEITLFYLPSESGRRATKEAGPSLSLNKCN